MMTSKLALELLHAHGVGRRLERAGSEATRVLFLLRRRAEHGDVGAEGRAQLDRHVPEAAEAHDPQPLPGAHVPVLEGRVGRDPRAQERRHALERDPRGNADGVGLVDDDPLGVTPARRSQLVHLGAVVRERDVRLAVLLEASRAARALAARVHEAPDAREVARLELLDRIPDARDATDDLVAGDHGKGRLAPLGARLVDVGVAHAAVEDLDLDVARSGVAALERERREGRARRGGGESSGRDHVRFPPGSGLGLALGRVVRLRIDPSRD